MTSAAAAVTTAATFVAIAVLAPAPGAEVGPGAVADVAGEPAAGPVEGLARIEEMPPAEVVAPGLVCLDGCLCSRPSSSCVGSGCLAAGARAAVALARSQAASVPGGVRLQLQDNSLRVSEAPSFRTAMTVEPRDVPVAKHVSVGRFQVFEHSQKDQIFPGFGTSALFLREVVHHSSSGSTWGELKVAVVTGLTAKYVTKNSEVVTPLAIVRSLDNKNRKKSVPMHVVLIENMQQEIVAIPLSHLESEAGKNDDPADLRRLTALLKANSFFMPGDKLEQLKVPFSVPVIIASGRRLSSAPFTIYKTAEQDVEKARIETEKKRQAERALHENERAVRARAAADNGSTVKPAGGRGRSSGTYVHSERAAKETAARNVRASVSVPCTDLVLVRGGHASVAPSKDLVSAELVVAEPPVLPADMDEAQLQSLIKQKRKEAFLKKMKPAPLHLMIGHRRKSTLAHHRTCGRWFSRCRRSRRAMVACSNPRLRSQNS